MPRTYGQVHYDLIADRGRASKHTCRCGNPAQEWAYLYNGEPELRSTQGYRYGEDVEKCYEPMCRSCHVKFDLENDPKYRESLNNNLQRANAARLGK